jgi:hypothetical protein
MRRIILAWTLAGVLSMPAKADEMLKWRQVQHTASFNSQQVGEGHFVNLYRISALALFPDGNIGTITVVGTNDTINGSGPVAGYLTLVLGDGSELWTKYTGTVTNASGMKNSPRNGTMTVIGGKGRYAGATGDGTWDGNGNSAGPEQMAYIDVVVNRFSDAHQGCLSFRDWCGSLPENLR